jgi:hypothetical protein
VPVYEFWVKNSVTDEPIPDAPIVLYRDMEMTIEVKRGVTDEAGHLIIDTLAETATAYTIFRMGYGQHWSTAIYPINDLWLAPIPTMFSVKFSAGSGGDVSPKGTLTVASDSRITATATPYAGLVFRAWVVDDKDYTTVNPYEFHISRDGMNIVAEFESEAEVVVRAIKEKVPVAPAPVVTVAVSGGIPWPFTWVGDVINWFGQAWNNVNKSLIDALRSEREEYQKATQVIEDYRIEHGDMQQRELTKSAGKGGWLWGGLFGSMDEIMQNLTEPLESAGKDAMDQALTATGEHSLDPKLKASVDALLKQIREIQEKAVEGTRHSAPDPFLALSAAWELAGVFMGTSVALETTAAVTDLVHPVKLIQARNIVSKLIDRLNINKITGEIVNMPVDKGIMRPVEKYYNSVFLPELPGYGDLQNMRMKEIIGQTEFEGTMKYHGYAPEWSRKMWDAHFIPPSLNDILTAWRRGIPVKYPKSDPATGTVVWIEKEKLDETDVRYLLESIDLDPRYIEIYETRKYVDPPLNITRFMFEEGVIKGDTVRELVALQGYRPEHVDYITKYITEFQERLWRRRYLVTLQGGYQKGVYSAAELEKAVLDAAYSADVARWIIANADARKKIEGEAVVTEEKAKLIGVGDLKKAYVRNMIDADKLRIDLGVRGYQTADVDLLIKLLDEEKVVTSAGGEKVALSVPEWLNAWRYGKATEDRVRMELQLRGLSLEEVEVLLSTKKAQWGVEGEEVP